MQLFLNNFSTSLAAAAGEDALQLSIPAADAGMLTGLGGANYYQLTAILRDAQGRESAWEVVRVIARNSGLLTVVRAQEGTTPLALPAGTELQLRLTAGTLVALQTQIQALSDRLAALENTGQEGVLLDASGNQLTDHLNNLLTGVSA